MDTSTSDKTRTRRSRVPLPAPLWRNPGHWIAFGFGAGLVPVAPGTAGTLVGIPLYLLLSPLPVTIYVGLVIALFVLGVPLCAAAARWTGVHDHPGIVWDEVVGLLVALIAVPAGWAWLGAAFVLFRVFDIAKPWPVGVADQRLAGGLGIMLDDVIAGLYALACLHGASVLLKWWGINPL